MDPIVKEALEWLEPLERKDCLWTYDKMWYVWTVFDEMNIPSGKKAQPLKDYMKAHINQILAETISLDAMKRYRKKINAPKSRFWWYIDKL
jgi:hypothetical protein